MATTTPRPIRSHIARVLMCAALVAAAAQACADPSGDAAADATSTTDAAATTVAPTTTTTLATTTTMSEADRQLAADTALILALYEGWNAAVDEGTTEIEAYFAAHLYPDLPECAPGEKTLSAYTPDPDTIARADDWEITWGPLAGTTPDGRVYEIQLAEQESASHVTILHGVAYVFWNCKGQATYDVDYEVELVIDDWGNLHATGWESQPGSGGNLGSGCSPGSGALPDGVWFGKVVAWTDDTIDFDLYCATPPGPDDEGPYVITNTNPAIRTVPVASDALVYPVVDGFSGPPQLYVAWRGTPHPPAFCGEEGCWLMWLFVNDGEVTEIVQVWFA